MKDYLNFIDISSWQKNLDMSAVFDKNPLDGVIVKATGGAGYVQATCDPWVQWLIRNGKPWGFYHFLNDDGKGSTGNAEAEFFVRNCENYFGDGVPVADFEAKAVEFGAGYVYNFLNAVYHMTGVKPMLYCNLSTVQRFKAEFQQIADEGYPLWLAQYANNKPTTFETEPWQNGSYAPFTKIAIHQYSDNGRLNGYSGALDLDRFYGTVDDWNNLVSGIDRTPDTVVTPQTELTVETLLRQLPADTLNIIRSAIDNIL